MLHPDYIHGQPSVELARLAETRGLGSIWVPETWGRDAVSYLARLVLNTSHIRLATGISPIFNRTPALLAQTIASLDEMSGGRVIAGLGVSGAKVVEDWHGQPFQRPLQRTREYVSIVRLALSGQRVNFEGELFQLHDFALLGVRPVQQRVPIFIAGLGPRNIELAGEIADGWLPIFLSPRHLPALRARLATGAARAGRSPSEVRIAAFVGACVTDDVDRDRLLLRRHMAYYVGGMGTYYNRLVAETYGYVEAAAAIQQAWRAGDRAAAAQHVPDALLDEVCISGPPPAARARLEEYLAAGVSPLLASPHGASFEDIARTIEAVT